jgi:hypothetical protein
MQGASMKVTQDLLGHASIVMTMRPSRPSRARGMPFACSIRIGLAEAKIRQLSENVAPKEEIEIYLSTNVDEPLQHSQQLVFRWIPSPSDQFRGLWQSFSRASDREAHVENRITYDAGRSAPINVGSRRSFEPEVPAERDVRARDVG